MTDYGRSLIRTLVPLAVGALVGWLARRGITVDSATVIPLVDSAVAAVYYAGVRALEARWPRLGWMLGAPGAPSYSPPSSMGNNPTSATSQAATGDSREVSEDAEPPAAMMPSA